MRMYINRHKYVCGVDLHAKSAYLCVLDDESNVRLHKNVPARADAVLEAVNPFRDDLVVGVESLFCWYWLADLCHEAGLDFILGHALYMRAVHGAKVKNDRVDSKRIAQLIKGGLFPMAYVYPKPWRATRDLLRRRTFFMRKRAELLAHIQLCRIQYNMEPLQKKIAYKANRVGVADLFDFETSLRASVAANLALIGHYDEVIRVLELAIKRHARHEAPELHQCLRTVPGIGPILALNVLYEVGDIDRFATVSDFVSYCRLIRPKKTSMGKIVAPPRGKIGNAQLKWTFSEAAAGFPRYNEWGKGVLERIKRKHGKAAMGVLAHKIGRATYYVMKRKTPFDPKRFER